MQTPIPANTFFGHVEKLYQTWKERHSDSMDSIILINGKVDDGNQRTVALISWFMAGFNLADTVLAFSPKIIIIYSSQRKINFLSNLKDHPGYQKFGLNFIARQDDAKAIYKQIWTKLHNSLTKPKVAMLLKDSKVGTIAQDFYNFIEGQNYQPIEASTIFYECSICKDSDEIQNLKKSGKVTTFFLSKFINQIQMVIDNAKPIKHLDLSKKIYAMLGNESQLKKCTMKLASAKITKDYIDLGPSLTVQSGGSYTSKLFTESNDNFLKSDCILIGLGTLYRSYNSYVARTLLIDPTNDQKNMYKKVEALQKVIILNLRSGVKISSIYKKAVEFMKENLPNVEIPKSFGFGIGIFLCQNNLNINETNDTPISIGHSFLINCTFVDLNYQSKKGPKTFAIQLIDTVIVSDKGQQILTNDASKSISDISYSLDDDEDKKQHREKQPTIESVQTSTRRRRKQQTTYQKMKQQKQRNQHQSQLKKIKLEELKTRLNQNFSGNFKKQKAVDCSKLICYKNKQQFPKELKKNQIYVDSKNNAILLPLYGRHIPFHINILKSVVKNDEGKFASLRFNFHLPGTLTNLIFPKVNQVTVYIKEMVFRSQHVGRIVDLEKQVKTLQRKVRIETDEKNAKEDMVEQQKINLNKGKKPVLRDLSTRPVISQKKVKGSLECHLNGFRYSSAKGQNIDVSFSNIKYAFFQPGQSQNLAAIHFRLHQPILIGKKKTQDIQFYTEGGPNAEDIRGRGDDSDDQERLKQARKKLDREFMQWMKACQQYIGKSFQFQIPRIKEGFLGAPYRNNSLLVPTKSCLINLTEVPFFVLPISDIEVACFERICANIRNFDITFVNKDYQTHIRINSIPINQIEKVKNWLDKNNITFYELGRSLNWGKTLQIIRADFKKFIQDGGWNPFDSDEDQEEQQAQDGDSQFSASSVQDEDDSQDSEDSQSDYQNEDQLDSDASQEDLSEEGLSWDQLDERAEQEDKNRLKREMEKNDQKQKNFQKKR